MAVTPSVHDELTAAEFRRRFPGENDVVEFKTGTGNQPLQDAIVAFSNADGGVILVGVKDDGTIPGRELNQGTLDAITQAFRDTRDPGRYTIRQIQVSDRPVTVIEVARRVHGFAQTSSGRVLQRQGTYKVPLFGDDLRRLLVERSLIRFEEHDAEVPLADVPPARLDHMRSLFGWPGGDGIADRLRERGLVMREVDHLSIAGAAYLLDDPADVLGKAYIEILRFPDAAGDYDRRVEIRGPLDHQVATATQQVSDELGHELVVLGVQRHEIPRLPVVVLREAIANAVAHRSYEASGTSVRIEIRPDAVTIVSPGGLPEPVTEQNIRDAQAARNLNMIGVLRRAGLAEDAGRGIDVMVDAMLSELLDTPEFHDLGHAVQVSLPVRSTVTVAERAWIREVERSGLIEPGDRLVLVHAARGVRLSNAIVRDLLGIDSADARQALGRLREAGLLEQHGTRGGSTYVLAPFISAFARPSLTHDQLDDLVVELAAEAPLANAAVRERTGLDRAQALRVLDRLVDAGRLERVGERRGTRYVLPSQGDEQRR